MSETQLSPKEVARILGLTTERVRQLARKGKLRSTFIGNMRVFDAEDVQRFKEERNGRRSEA